MMWLLLLLSTASAEPDLGDEWTVVEEDDLPKSLQKAIKTGQKQLKKEQYRQFLEAFVHPEDLAEIGDFDGLVASFAEDKAQEVQEALALIPRASVWRVASDSKGEGWVVEVTALDESLPKDLLFLKADSKWRLAN